MINPTHTTHLRHVAKLLRAKYARVSEIINEPRFNMGRLRLLSEAPARFGRLLAHAQSQPFIMLSAARGNLSTAENTQRSKELVGLLRSRGLGAIQTEGHWVEDSGPVAEPSFFVPLTGHTSIEDGDELLKFGVELGIRFQQQAILYGDGKWVYEFDCRTGDFIVKSSVNEITQENLGDMFTRIRNRSFQFGRQPADKKKPMPEYRMIGYRIPTGYFEAIGMAAVGLWPESK